MKPISEQRERKMTGYAYTRAGELVPCLQKVVSCLTYLD